MRSISITDLFSKSFRSSVLFSRRALIRILLPEALWTPFLEHVRLEEGGSSCTTADIDQLQQEQGCLNTNKKFFKNERCFGSDERTPLIGKFRQYF